MAAVGSAASLESTPVSSWMVCRLTKERFVDPVVAEGGESYERAALLMWFSKHGAVSPTTGRVMRHTDLLPNHTLRSIMSGHNPP